MAKKYDKPYMDGKKKQKQKQTEQLIINGETLEEINKKKNEYKEKSLNE